MSIAESPSVAARHSTDARQQRPLGSGRRTGARVVEREERGRATERGRHRVLEEPVGFGIRRDPRVRVDIDNSGEHQQPGRIDHLVGGSRETAEVRLDRGDPPAIDGDIRHP